MSKCKVYIIYLMLKTSVVVADLMTIEVLRSLGPVVNSSLLSFLHFRRTEFTIPGHGTICCELCSSKV